MASKEVMIVTPEEMQQMLVPSEKAMDAYRFALAHAGIEMDEGAEQEFIAQRNAKNEGFRELVEVQKWMEKTAASIKEATKHTMNVGSEDDLPAGMKWSKQSYTYDWMEGAAEIMANTLIERGLVSQTQLFQQLTVSQISKASGMTVEKLAELVPDVIIAKPKERTLSIK